MVAEEVVFEEGTEEEVGGKSLHEMEVVVVAEEVVLLLENFYKSNLIYQIFNFLRPKDISNYILFIEGKIIKT